MEIHHLLKQHLETLNLKLNVFQNELFEKARFPLENMLIVAGTGIGKL